MLDFNLKLPPNRTEYDDSVRRLLAELTHADPAPPLMIAHLCWRVIVRALGGEWTALSYFGRHVVGKAITSLRVRCWWFYQRRVCGRTDEQVHALLDPPEDKTI